MTKRQRRNFSAAEKVAAVRRHLLENVKVSAICEELEIVPNQFYQWQKQFFENGTNAFTKESKAQERRLQKKITDLEQKLIHKDNVISEIMSDFIATKKRMGSFKLTLGRA